MNASGESRGSFVFFNTVVEETDKRVNSLPQIPQLTNTWQRWDDRKVGDTCPQLLQGREI